MRKFFASLFVALLVTGCAAIGVDHPPQTPRDNLVAQEVAFQAASDTVKQLAQDGLIVPGSPTATRVGQAFLAARAALDVWQLAPDSRDRMVAAIAAIRSLQTILSGITRQMNQQSSNQHTLALLVPNGV